MAGAIAAIGYKSGTAATVQLHNQNITNSDTVAPVIAEYVVGNDRNIKDQNSSVLEAWLSSGSTANYDVRATFQSGTSPSGDALSTWLNCATSRAWSVSSSTNNTTISSQFLVEIRLTSTGITQASATITLSATKQSGGGSTMTL